jgi:hypothetical protein
VTLNAESMRCDMPFSLPLFSSCIFKILSAIQPPGTSFDRFLLFGTPFGTPFLTPGFSQKKSGTLGTPRSMVSQFPFRTRSPDFKKIPRCPSEPLKKTALYRHSLSVRDIDRYGYVI